ncbi:54S ribosomal protein L9 [Yarrowia sp. C11]|nr:54S ribosomal protein L9 [Yarrowia sp. C11]KAG5364568.1 54S ribosomal protein L9 [Yarrowia sp. E02]
MLPRLRLLAEASPARIFSRGVAQLISPNASVPVSEAPARNNTPAAAYARKQLVSRTGALAFKRGMISWYDENGVHMPATVLEIDLCQVVGHKTEEVHGYNAVQVGMGHKKKAQKNMKKSKLGQFSAVTVNPKESVAEFRIRGTDGLLPVTTEITASHFKVGQYVDVQATSKGKGFAGVMKRHGFSGLPASHGVSLKHRSGGTTGQNTDPGRVFPGRKMAGNMGNETVTLKNQKVLSVDEDTGIVIIKGMVPGSKGKIVKLSDSRAMYGVAAHDIKSRLGPLVPE